MRIFSGERADRGDALGAIRDPVRRPDVRRPDVSRARHVEARPDQEEVARVEVIPLCDFRDRGVVVARDRRKGLAGTDDMNPGQRALAVVMGLVM